MSISTKRFFTENEKSQSPPSYSLVTSPLPLNCLKLTFLKPDGSTLIVGNRNDTTFGTSPPTDSLATFSISPKDGSLTKFPLISAYGSYPRSFSMNKAGTLMAVGLQMSGSLVILEHNKSTGLFDNKVADIKFVDGADQPNCVVWDE